MKTLASLSLPPQPNAVAQAMAWLESLAEKEQWDPRTTFKLNLCLDEALTNIVMYGFTDTTNDTPPARITLEVLSDADSIVLNLIDNGIAFDPTRACPGDLADSVDDADIGGHGLRIMQHYLQSIEYSRNEEHNQLRLTLVPDSGKT